VHLQIFPVNYAYFFSALYGGCRCTHCTPGYAYGYSYILVRYSPLSWVRRVVDVVTTENDWWGAFSSLLLLLLLLLQTNMIRVQSLENALR